VDRDRLGALLAAVGNHEAKALTFLAMEPDVEYGVSSLHRRFLEIQGDRVAFKGTVNLQQKYVTYTFEPVGLVARTLAGGRYLRHIKTDPDETATALAANLLVLTEGLPTPLAQLFGKTAAKEGHDRSPVRRLDALRVIHASAHPVTQAQLLKNRRPRSQRRRDAQRPARGRLDLLRDVDDRRAEVQLSDHTTTASGCAREGLTRDIREVLNARLVTQPEGFVITRDEIEDVLLADPQRAGRYIRDTLQGTMARLADRGYVELVESFRGQRAHSSISLTPDQRDTVGRLLTVTEAIQAEDPGAIRRGVVAANDLLADPPRVRALLRRCFDNNKVLVNPLSAAQKERLVLEALQSGPFTSAELLERLSPGLNKGLLSMTLRDLSRAGLIIATRADRTPAKVYALAADPSE
jgi:hypothetical protein